MGKRTFLWVAGFYRACISPLYPPCCRFYPTCSRYAAQAVHRHGLLRGGLLALFRILRCNPLFKSGLDPVPEHVGWKSIFGVLKKNG